jgi:hypothetical protein
MDSGSRVFIVEEIDGIGSMKSEDNTAVNVETLLEALLNMSLNLSVSLMKPFAQTAYISGFLEYQLPY